MPEPTTTPPESTPMYLTVAQAAEFANVSPSTVRHLIRTDQVPVHRIGRSLRIKRATLLDLIEASVSSPLSGDDRPRRTSEHG